MRHLTPMIVPLLAVLPLRAAGADELVDFNRDIRPLLSDRCYACHGPDEKQLQAGLRLDQKEGALGETEYGNRAIVPGDRQASAVWERITSDDESLRMPPAEHGKPLTKAEIETIGRWIDQGAEWKGHWAFIQPVRREPPPTKWEDRVRNPIDRFIFARLAKAGLEPSPEADKQTLIRRVTFDLTGLPPTLAEIDAFLADESPGAYEKVVDRLLRSPRYGEHMARYWLDAARYGDTHGLHLDNERSIWPYRDWVIEAFNENMPFDRFTVAQIAGDLLPDATIEQQVATGFNRCNVTTSEGGSIAEEFRVRYAVDRTEAVGTVWLGLTVGCAVCHDHKFDPISQQEFYQLYAYYNSTADPAMDGNKRDTPPVIRIATPEQERRLAELEQQTEKLRETIRTTAAKYAYTDPGPEADLAANELQEVVWIDDELPPGATPQGNEAAASWKFVSAPEHPVHSGEKSTVRTAPELSQHFFTGANPPLAVGANDRLFAHVYLDPKNPPQQIMLQFNDGTWEHRAVWGADKIPWGRKGTANRFPMGPLPPVGEWVRLEVKASDVGLKPGSKINGWAFTQYGGTVHWDCAGILTTSAQTGASFTSLAAWEQVQKRAGYNGLPADVTAALRIEPARRSDAQRELVKSHFIANAYAEAQPVFAKLQGQLDALQKEMEQIREKSPQSLVMADMQSLRPTFVLTRGEYDHPDKSQPVEPNVPAVLPPLPPDAPPNRLGLARWLVDEENPLTARVTVNRYWQRFFGTGLVKTAEDFGAQGEWPTHPDLLDWLAVEFMESGWNVKHMQKLIAMSAAYRQESGVRGQGSGIRGQRSEVRGQEEPKSPSGPQPSTLNAQRVDPENRLLARGPRFRLPAEAIRDTALAVSGLLVEEIGGPSVKPYQPPGLWEAVGYTSSNTAKFTQDHGDALYRRSLYTFWKRTSPPPSLSTFDAPSREACTVRRPRTNTPLQALVLMNDVQFVEAARHFAERMLTEGGDDTDARLVFGFRLATGRRPSGEELGILHDVLDEHLSQFRGDPEAAKKLIGVGESPRNESLDPAEHAAWTMLGSLLLNLDETITKG